MQFSIVEFRPSSLFKILAFTGLLAVGLTFSGCNEDPTGPASDGKITLTSPKGGESFKVGDSLRVTWTVTDDPSDPVNNVDVQFSPNDGMTWGFLKTGSIPVTSPLWGKYAWKIKDTLTIGTEKFPLAGNAKCRVRVMQYGTDDPKEISATASAITISAP